SSRRRTCPNPGFRHGRRSAALPSPSGPRFRWRRGRACPPAPARRGGTGGEGGRRRGKGGSSWPVVGGIVEGGGPAAGIDHGDFGDAWRRDLLDDDDGIAGGEEDRAVVGDDLEG